MNYNRLLFGTLICILFAGCGGAQLPELGQTARQQPLNFEIRYDADTTLAQQEDGVELTLPSGNASVQVRVLEDTANYDEAFAKLGIEHVEEVRDGQLAPGFSGKTLHTEVGRGREKLMTDYRIGLTGDRLYLVQTSASGAATGGERKLAEAIANSFALLDASVITPTNFESTGLNLQVTAPGSYKIEEDAQGVRILAPGGRAGLLLLSLPYEGGATELEQALKAYVAPLAQKRQLTFAKDAENPANGYLFSLDYMQDGKACTMNLHFTAFGGKVYAIGQFGEKAQLSRWRNALEEVLNSFRFLKEGQAAPELAQIRERSIPGTLGSPLVKGEPLPDSAFAKTVLLGDSLTYGFLAYQMDIPAKVVANESVNVGQFSSAAVIQTPMGNTTMLDALLNIQPDKVYILLGVNSLSLSKEGFVAAYKRMIDQIRQQLPGTTIYIQSVLPITRSRSQGSNPNIRNGRITEFNEALQVLCWQEEIYYVDVAEAFRGKDGYLPEDWSADGIHIGPKSYVLWFDYLRTHGN